MATNPVTGVKTPGKAPKWDFAKVHAKEVNLTQEGKDGKMYTVPSIEYVISNYSEALEVCGGSDEKVWAAFSDFITDYSQRSDRSKLSQKAQGPAKAIVKAAKDFIKMFDQTPEAALEMVLNLGVSKGVYSEDYVKENRADLLDKLNDRLKGKASDDEDETEETPAQ